MRAMVGVALLAMARLLASGAGGDLFMGPWSGSFQAEGGDTGPFQMQVVPMGRGTYSIWVRMGELGSRYEIKGVSEAGRLKFQGRYQMAAGTDEAAYDLVGEILDGKASGRFSSSELNGKIELSPVRRIPLVPGVAPTGAVPLIGPASQVAWRRADGGVADWAIQSDGSWEAGATDLVTRREFSSFRLHVEFMLPLQTEKRGLERGRSGVGVGGACEVRILDSFAQEPARNSCGAIVGVAAPRTDACLPPLEWQELEVVLRRPALESASGQSSSALITVTLNGVVVHERLKLDGIRRAPVELRAGGSPVRFRNIWLQAIEP